MLARSHSAIQIRFTLAWYGRKQGNGGTHAWLLPPRNDLEPSGWELGGSIFLSAVSPSRSCRHGRQPRAVVHIASRLAIRLIRFSIGGPAWCPTPHRRTRLHWVQQRPVALLQAISLWKRWPQFQPQGTQDTIVAIIALQHDAGERRRGSSARCTELPGYRLADGLVKICKRHPGQARQMIERFAHQFGVAAERDEDVGLNRRVVRAGHAELLAGGNDHGGNDTQIVALEGAKRIFRGHDGLNRTDWRGAASSDRRYRAQWPEWWKSDSPHLM